MGEVAEFKPQQPVHVGLDEIHRMAEAVAKSGLFGVKTPEQAMSLMLVAQAEGLHPAIAARDYDIIQGRPAKKSEAMLRSFIANGGRVKWITLDDKCAEAVFSHPQGGEVSIKWDMARATVAGLTSKDMYKKYPRQMLRARCISEGVRTVCPMATSGMYVPEEIVDMEPAKPSITVEVPSLSADEFEQLRKVLEGAAAKSHDEFKVAWEGLTRDQRRALASVKDQIKETAARKAAAEFFGEEEGNG